MLHLLSQELWGLLASACEQTSGIPKKILDDKAEELRIKNEAQKAIQVSKPVACNGCKRFEYNVDGYNNHCAVHCWCVSHPFALSSNSCHKFRKR